MNWSSRRSMWEMLNDHRKDLDGILGAGQYEIEDEGPHAAIVRWKNIAAQFVEDRNRLIWANVGVTHEQAEVSSPTDVWLAFLNEEMPLQQTDADGWVIASADDQIAGELRWLARINEQTFSSPEMTAAAAEFVRGYNGVQRFCRRSSRLLETQRFDLADAG